MDIIQSRNNALIKHAKKLKDKKYRIENKSFIVEGFRFVEEALKSSFDVENVFVSEDTLKNKYTESIISLIEGNTKVYCVNNIIMKDICNTETPQGIAAIVKMKEYSLQNKEGFYVFVDRIQDPGNLGTIIRTAHAAGAVGVLYSRGTVDIYNEKTLRSTMGSMFYLPIIEDSKLELLSTLKNSGFKVIVSSLDTEKNFFDVNLKDKIVICVGNEGNGLSEAVYLYADEKVKIPMPGGAESLNASIAASIMIYEALRQNLLK